MKFALSALAIAAVAANPPASVLKFSQDKVELNKLTELTLTVPNPCLANEKLKYTFYLEKADTGKLYPKALTNYEIKAASESPATSTTFTPITPATEIAKIEAEVKYLGLEYEGSPAVNTNIEIPFFYKGPATKVTEEFVFSSVCGAKPATIKKSSAADDKAPKLTNSSNMAKGSFALVAAAIAFAML